MAKFKPYHEVTGSGTIEIGSSPYGKVAIHTYGGTATCTVGFIDNTDTFVAFSDDGSTFVAPQSLTVNIGKGMRLALQYSADVKISVTEVC